MSHKKITTEDSIWNNNWSLERERQDFSRKIKSVRLQLSAVMKEKSEITSRYNTTCAAAQEKATTLRATIHSATERRSACRKRRISVQDLLKQQEEERRKNSKKLSTEMREGQTETEDRIHDVRSITATKRLLANATRLKLNPKSTGDVIQGVILTTPMMKPFRIDASSNTPAQISDQLWSLIGD